MSDPRVSVIIPAFNGEKYIGETIQSILAQTHRPLEVLVVDDGSTDRTAEIVQRFGEPVRYIRQENAGTAAARNRAVAESRGEFIALLDQDDLWVPDKLARQIPRFAEDPRIGLVFAGIEFFDTRSGKITSTYFPGPELSLRDLLAHVVLPVQTILFRKSALEKIGPFDTTLGGTDDWDIGIRMAAEFRMVGVDEILGRVRLHDTQQGRNTDRMFHNAMRVLDKHANIRPGDRAIAAAIRKGRDELREHQYGCIKGRAFEAWNAGRYFAAATQSIRAFLQYPPALKRVVGRIFNPSSGAQV
jgi:glycosyltransferase involved in cell wall biosynthesis